MDRGLVSAPHPRSAQCVRFARTRFADLMVRFSVRAACRPLVGVLMLTVAACGEATATIEGSGGNEYLVIVGNSGTINTFLDHVKGSIAVVAGTASGLQTSAGDKHRGTLICQTDVHDRGTTYHVSWYSTQLAPDARFCQAMVHAVEGRP